MRRSFARLKGLGYITWHARHLLYHILLGIAWMWIIRDQFVVYTPKLLLLAIAGSLFPDIEHLVFFITYGKRDGYTTQITRYLKDHDWRVLATFVEQGHKYNTRLSYHSVYTIGIFTAVSFVFLLLRSFAGFVFFGAMVVHYLFDMLDDMATLGKLNNNWFRWGKSKTKTKTEIWKKLDRTINR